MTALSAAETQGNCLRLVGQLERKLYLSVNKVLEAAGGKWSAKAKAHVFDGDAADVIEPILLTGTYQRTKQDFGQFDSPPEVVAALMALAGIQPGMKVYEPSAGIGNIVEGVVGELKGGATVFANEIDPKRLTVCRERFFNAFGAGGLTCRDFLSIDPAPVFDRVVMNPPFAKQADISHVLHAAQFLKAGGRLVSVMSAGVTFRQDGRTKRFREFLTERAGEIQALPANAFRESGTSVNTVIVAFDQ
ncbi:methyltransferase [Chelatococcus asaccharovorans]|nr:methyltransferase [Chelatococcus asaccharovorans]MBS7703293.1 SAM-dependent DNA methyltransferase [Chelatococcus asaccharovorans]